MDPLRSCGFGYLAVPLSMWPCVDALILFGDADEHVALRGCTYSAVSLTCGLAWMHFGYLVVPWARNLAWMHLWLIW